MEKRNTIASGPLEQLRRSPFGVDAPNSRPFRTSSLCIHQIIEEQVERTPDAIALVCAQRRLTYRQLNSEASDLSKYLIQCGVQPEEKVAICVTPQAELVISMLAILKAGGAYVPLDPFYPRARLRYIIEQATPIMIVADVRGREVIGEEFLESIANVNIEESGVWREMGEPNRMTDCVRAKPSNLAYVIYTSGSTGVPKGVMVEHQSLVNCLTALAELLEVQRSDRVLSLTTVSFDIAALEILLPLMTGACIVQASAEERYNASKLERLLEERNVTLMQATPSGWELLLSCGWNGSPKLRALCGGELLSRGLAARLVNRVAALWNLYGPTETTIWSCAERIIAPSGYDKISEPLGGPLANTRIYILNAQGAVVQPPEIGEIYIGGAGVARGYLGHPDLTSEKFLPDVFSDICCERMFRTGDRGRFRIDGKLEFVGRIDHQVKVRGYRVELGEIESTLLLHSAVREAVVLLRDDCMREHQLVAYLKLDYKEPEILNQELLTSFRNHLAALLPEFMIPDAFVILESFPRLLNGKTDRGAFPIPDSKSYVHGNSAAPQGDVECVLANIWKEILGLVDIQRQDNFFVLGGHSLSATEMAAAVLLRFDVELEIKEIFEFAVLSRLAALVSEKREGNAVRECCDELRATVGGAASEVLAAPRIERRRLSPMERWWVDLERVVPQKRQPLIVLEMSQSCAIDAWRRAVGECMRRHAVLRTRFVEGGADGIEAISMDFNDCDIEVHDYSDLESSEGTRKLTGTVAQCRGTRFQIIGGKLFRVVVVNMSASKHVLLFAIHHAVTDGWSNRLLASELRALYLAFVAGRPSPFPDSPRQLATYLVHDRRWGLRGNTADSPNVWEVRLADVKPMNLPSDRRREVIDGFYREGQVPIDFPSEVILGLKCVCREFGVTLPIIMLGVYALVLSRWAGRKRILMGSYMACRTSPRADEIVGCFARNVPILVTIESGVKVGEFINCVREAYLAGLDVRHIVSFELSWKKGLNRVVANFEKLENDVVGVDDKICEVEEFPRISHEVMFSLRESQSRLYGFLSYATEIYCETRIDAVRRAIVETAAAVHGSMHRAVGDIVSNISYSGLGMTREW